MSRRTPGPSPVPAESAELKAFTGALATAPARREVAFVEWVPPAPPAPVATPRPVPVDDRTPVELLWAAYLAAPTRPARDRLSELLADDAAPDPMAVVQARETIRQLEAAVAQLGERDRLVVRLCYLENRTLAEIGRTLGVTESRVCQLHTRLVGRLRGRLEELAAG